MERVRRVIKKTLKYVSKPEMRVLPGQLAFFFVLSLIPLVALVGTLASYFSISTGTITDLLDSILPFDINDSMLSFVAGKGMTFNIAIFFLSGFILASNGTHSMIITSNEIYKVNDENIVRRRLKAIWMTIILVLLLLFLLLVPVYGMTIFDALTQGLESDAVNNARAIYKVLQYPISLGLVYYNIKLLYTIAPDRKIKPKTTTTGAIFTTVGWIIATELYSIYAGTFANYNLFYGSISDILIWLVWVYILSYIFVLGMSINATNAEIDDYETMQLTLKNIKLEEEKNKKKDSKK